MSWGYKIVLTLVVFVGIIITMVAICIRQDDIHLVSENYYEDEIAYQARIEKIQYGNQVLQLEWKAKAQELEIRGPKGLEVSGKVTFFRPSDARLDQIIDFQPNTEGVMKVSTQSLVPGKWMVQLEGKSGERGFYQQKSIWIP